MNFPGEIATIMTERMTDERLAEIEDLFDDETPWLRDDTEKIVVELLQALKAERKAYRALGGEDSDCQHNEVTTNSIGECRCDQCGRIVSVGAEFTVSGGGFAYETIPD